jgi:maleylacetoacetate isomerase
MSEPAHKKVKTSTVLYSYWRSSCSWRVRIALALKEQPYEYVAVHLFKKENGKLTQEQLLDEYKSKNPSKEVPILEIDGLRLAQSIPIIEYLDETRSDGVRLLPKEPAKRHVVRRVSEMITSNIQPVQNLRVLLYLMAKFEDPTEKQKEKIAWGHHWIEQGFIALEEVLATTAGTYCVGDDITMADLCLVPQVYNANRFNVDMKQFPIISRIDETLSKLAPFLAAHPDAQPDAE